jgi:AbrB family looped-hinge helix DNA binding protein
MKLTLDKAGRIVLPKPLRDELHLEPGDALEIESSGEDITIRPARGQAQLRKKHGIWVYRAGEPLSTATVSKTVRQIRRERDRLNVGDEE